jgi:hypothetical protein
MSKPWIPGYAKLLQSPGLYGIVYLGCAMVCDFFDGAMRARRQTRVHEGLGAVEVTE